ncbi:MAG TPA: hypothetical protein VJX23_01950 [Candidatus Binataceae bacterium]|nr:hypothetical protein [Candidatus Binataceae bacterium]
MATAKKKSSKKLSTKQMKKTKGGLSNTATSMGSLSTSSAKK